jgi:hypothetical protein
MTPACCPIIEYDGQKVTTPSSTACYLLASSLLLPLGRRATKEDLRKLRWRSLPRHLHVVLSLAMA